MTGATTGAVTAAAGEQPTPRGGAALAWLAHPVTLLALALLLVNDHLWKPAAPGLLTGKVSDLAGLVVAPPLLTTVLTLVAPRAPGRAVAVAAVVATGAGFAAVQLSAAAAAVATRACSALAGPCQLYADPTDLVALPALALAWWVWRRARRRPAPHRLVRLGRVLLVLPTAALAVGATSVHYPYASAAGEWNGGLVAGERNAAFDRPQEPYWRFSDDGGRQWRSLELAEQERMTAQLAVGQTVRRQGCVPGDRSHCYRLVAGTLQVQESRDGGASWQASWEVTDAQRRALARHYRYLGDPVRELSSVALVVHPTGDGHVVVVANGRDGFALRTTDGQWHRIGFPTRGGRVPHWDDPIRTTLVPYGLLWGMAATVLAALAVLETVRRPASRRRWRWLVAAPGLLLTAAGLAWLLDVNAVSGPPDGLQLLLVGTTGAGMVGLGLLLWLADPLANQALAARQWLVMAPGAVLVGSVTAVPLLAVSPGHPVALVAAILQFGAGTTAVATATWGAGRRRATAARHPG